MSFKSTLSYITVSLFYGDIAYSKIKTEYSVPSLQNPWFYSLRISERLKMTGSYAKRNNEWKGGIYCSLTKFRSCLKSPDKSKIVTNKIFLSLTNMERIYLQIERKQLGLSLISQKLATFPHFDPLTTT